MGEFARVFGLKYRGRFYDSCKIGKVEDSSEYYASFLKDEGIYKAKMKKNRFK